MMNPNRYDGAYGTHGWETPSSSHHETTRDATASPDAAIENAAGGAAPSAAAPPRPSNQVTREELEAQSQQTQGRSSAFLTPQFYVGFRGPEGASAAGPTGNTGGGEVPAGGAGTAATGNPEDAAETVEPELSIEEILSKVVIHTHKPIENLPTIAPPELKIIGRAVTFKGETKMGENMVMMHYEGLVGTINKDTVMLIHVHRFTEEDYQVHKLEIIEQRQQEERDEKSTTNSPGGNQSSKQEPPTTEEEASKAVEAAVTHQREDHTAYTPEAAAAPSPHINETDGLDMNRSVGAVSPMLALPNAVTGRDHEDLNRRVRNRLRNNTGSMGPIPFMTFSRAHIHQVEFAQDPRSDFYSLFQDPTKEFFDMQCLRMFCRRYIIHTAQGNNPRLIPLRAFVTCRCNCPNLDNDLLVRVTQEEIGHLVKVHRDVQRAKKRKETNRRSVLRMYRAPPGLFRYTGVLYLTHIPKQTLLLGALEVVMAIVISLYAVVSLTTAEEYFIRGYVNEHVPYVLPGIILSSFSGLCAVMHAVRMSLPLSSHFFLAAARILVVTCAIGANLMTMIAIGQSFKIGKVRDAFESTWPNELCGYYKRNLCVGFDYVNCSLDDSANSSADALTRQLCDCVPKGSPPCRNVVMASIESTMIPIVCFSLVQFILLWFDHFLHYKLFYVGRLLMQRM